VRTTKQTYNLEQELREEAKQTVESSSQVIKIPLLHEMVEQLKLMNNTLEEIHDELHELTNRGSY
jgi:hypothetical protein